jgi:hypothetical protein
MDLVKEKQNLLKKAIVQKQAPKQSLRKQEQLRQNGVEVAKETENLHKIIILLR